MKKVCCLFIVIGLMMVMFALPAAAAEELTSDFSTGETAVETIDEIEMDEIEIEDEETPLAGLPGMARSDVARIIVGAGCCMAVAAGTILFWGLRHGHARR